MSGRRAEGEPSGKPGKLSEKPAPPWHAVALLLLLVNNGCNTFITKALLVVYGMSLIHSCLPFINASDSLVRDGFLKRYNQMLNRSNGFYIY